MIDKPIDVEKCYGMEKNVEENKGNDSLKATIPSTVQLE
jgi:hypothetical protein